MAKRKVLKYGDERLRKVAKPVTEFDDDLRELLDDMRDTMYANDGMGLAATQVGVLRRVVIMDLGGSFFELINPEIIASEGEQEEEEGCLSVPNFSDLVKRPEKVTVKAKDRYGYDIEITGEKTFARCACHEIDHLNGILYVDKSKNRQKYFEKYFTKYSTARTGTSVGG